MSDVATIARKLTTAQRDEVLRGAISGDHSPVVAMRLINKGLMAHRVDSPSGKWGFIEATPLGKQVADYIRQSLTKGEKA